MTHLVSAKADIPLGWQDADYLCKVRPTGYKVPQLVLPQLSTPAPLWISGKTMGTDSSNILSTVDHVGNVLQAVGLRSGCHWWQSTLAYFDYGNKIDFFPPTPCCVASFIPGCGYSPQLVETLTFVLSVALTR